MRANTDQHKPFVLAVLDAIVVGLLGRADHPLAQRGLPRFQLAVRRRTNTGVPRHLIVTAWPSSQWAPGSPQSKTAPAYQQPGSSSRSTAIPPLPAPIAPIAPVAIIKKSRRVSPSLMMVRPVHGVRHPHSFPCVNEGPLGMTPSSRSSAPHSNQRPVASVNPPHRIQGVAVLRP